MTAPPDDEPSSRWRTMYAKYLAVPLGYALLASALSP